MFLDSKAKATFKSIFGNLEKILDDNITSLPNDYMGEDISEDSIKESFTRLKNVVSVMKIPMHVKDSLRNEFENHRNINQIPSNVYTSKDQQSACLNQSAKQGDQREQKRCYVTNSPRGQIYSCNQCEQKNKSDRGLKIHMSKTHTKLTQQKSNKPTNMKHETSQKVQNSSVVETIYLCPLAPSCSFSCTKKDIKEMILPMNHLTKVHNISRKKLDKAPTGKFKFEKCKKEIKQT